ncbi:hypothetical protein HDV00_005677 [Rhizophlyctis rosea]|nr:hypothetical protein HDV00_005677 [Rhizophlyctis rosea]
MPASRTLANTLLRTSTRSISTSIAARAPAANQRNLRSDGQGHSGSHMSNNDPHVLEKEKQATVKAGAKGKWNEKLASTSEAAVKADRDFHGKADDIEELQKKSAQQLAGKGRASHV